MEAEVVSYRNSTSNHNYQNNPMSNIMLYLIEILHQTTTRHVRFVLVVGCILSKFYIKPQPRWEPVKLSRVVSYRNSTSNHNCPRFRLQPEGLYLIEILHQTTTRNRSSKTSRTLYLIEILHQTTTQSEVFKWGYSCILSKFYIKPQHMYDRAVFVVVVSYRNSTSNHNVLPANVVGGVVVSYRNSTSNHNPSESPEK